MYVLQSRHRGEAVGGCSLLLLLLAVPVSMVFVTALARSLLLLALPVSMVFVTALALSSFLSSRVPRPSRDGSERAGSVGERWVSPAGAV